MEYPFTLGLFLSFIFGTAIGSFLNVVVLRLPKEEKLSGRSHCNSCGHQLGIMDLVPLFSYLFLLGKCRYCGKKFSNRYFLLELITGLLFAVAYSFIVPTSLLGLSILLKIVFIISVLIAVFVIDFEHYLILDSIIFPSIISLIIFNFILDFLGRSAIFSWQGNFVSGLVAAVLAPLPFFLVWFFSQGRWMGFGDVKLAIFLGMALGLPQVFVGIMLGVLLGGASSVILLAFMKQSLKSQVPFGTFLALGSILAIFVGKPLLHWYLALLGF